MASDLNNVATISALLAGATATMLQFSFITAETGGLAVAVNTLWFAALILTISSAFKSLWNQIGNKSANTIIIIYCAACMGRKG